MQKKGFQQNWNKGFLVLSLHHIASSARAEGSWDWGISMEHMNFEK